MSSFNFHFRVLLQKILATPHAKRPTGQEKAEKMEAIRYLYEDHVYKLAQNEQFQFLAKEAEGMLNDVLIALLSLLDGKDDKLMVKHFNNCFKAVTVSRQAKNRIFIFSEHVNEKRKSIFVLI
jgi:hypothetical protein